MCCDRNQNQKLVFDLLRLKTVDCVINLRTSIQTLWFEICQLSPLLTTGKESEKFIFILSLSENSLLQSIFPMLVLAPLELKAFKGI
jgi:hypothetical protein